MTALRYRDTYDECGYDRYNNYVCYNNSAWNSWARWVVLAIIVIGFFVLFALCSCFTARRRRRAGQQPFYGTGWAARPHNGQQTYAHNGTNNYQAPPPQYSAQNNNNNGGYYGAGTDSHGQNQGYYGTGNGNGNVYGQSNGVELQQPKPTFARDQQHGQAEYAPPPGPPPAKGDGIIR